MLENYQDGFGAGRGVLLPFDRATIRIANLARNLREKVDRMRTLFIANEGAITCNISAMIIASSCLPEIDVNLLKLKLLPQFEELETGMILRIPHLVTSQNPEGLLRVRGGILVFATDLPEGNSQTSCKKQSGAFSFVRMMCTRSLCSSGNFPSRYALISKERISFETKDELIMASRVDEVHRREFQRIARLPAHSAHQFRTWRRANIVFILN